MKKRNRTLVSKIFFLLGIFFFLVSVVFFIRAYKEMQPYIKLDHKQKELQLLINNTEVTVEEDPMERRIDFKKLREINPDIIAWLYAPGIDVDQPILKGKTDTEYLTKDFQGKYSPLGSVFTYSNTKSDFTESKIFLFAHNTYSNQMFSQLEKYQDTEFFSNNKKIYVYLENRVMELEAIDTDIKLFNDPFFQNKGEKEQLIILSTCTTRLAKEYRFVVRFRVSRERGETEKYEE